MRAGSAERPEVAEMAAMLAAMAGTRRRPRLAVGDPRGDGGSLRIVVAEDDLIIRIAATCAVNLRRLIGRRACIGSSAVDSSTRAGPTRGAWKR